MSSTWRRWKPFGPWRPRAECERAVKTGATILIYGLAGAALVFSVAGAEPVGQPDKRIVPGSRQWQLLLKQRLDDELPGTLVAELNRNKKQWRAMSPEELRDLRKRYFAYLALDQKTQAALLKVMPEFEKLSAEQKQLYRRRAAWLKKVVASLSRAEREELKKLTPTERAARLLKLKALLPTSGPTSRPSTATAKPPAHGARDDPIR